MTEIIKKHYKDNDSNDIGDKSYTIEELNKKILPTSKINEKYKHIVNINISSEKYLENLQKNYTVSENEIWRKYPKDENFEVSNYGRVKYKNELLDFKDTKKLAGYLLLDFKNEKSLLCDKFVYQMVAETWLIKPDHSRTNTIYEIHHISNDGYDNRVENLIYLTKKEHSKIRHKTNE